MPRKVTSIGMKLVEGAPRDASDGDIDRLAAFYKRVFDATKTLDTAEEGVRHVKRR